VSLCFITQGVEERSILSEVSDVSQDGQDRSEYAGMSSDNSDKKSEHRKPEVSWGRLIRPGLVGP